MLFKNIVILLAAVAAAAPLEAREAQPETVANTQDYLIIFRKGFDTPDRLVRALSNNLKSLGAKINFEYHTVIKGFAVSMPKSLVDEVVALSDSEFPFVVEEDKEARPLI
ncbi:hypothetical protein B9G98_03474 [Wickerhamiella sorbophila]|uniref:Inhibitor I9 domain-containing protein n=1 Tax=Wickerhamiella sorbophila TaxID=45607 RepID=A0A2T0FLI6_9ASCO|nr:hypothetical protein B9G98_03474 [Wickerhamiella sorbophila]PRT55854.1 hypothetical protein B9G98_03474 [Wickerhamiella sorbophila]